MTKQEQNEIIIRHIDAEIREKPEVAQQIGITFNKWIQALIQMGIQPPIEEQQQQEEAA